MLRFVWIVRTMAEWNFWKIDFFKGQLTSRSWYLDRNCLSVSKRVMSTALENSIKINALAVTIQFTSTIDGMEFQIKKALNLFSLYITLCRRNRRQKIETISFLYLEFYNYYCTQPLLLRLLNNHVKQFSSEIKSHFLHIQLAQLPRWIMLTWSRLLLILTHNAQWQTIAVLFPKRKLKTKTYFPLKKVSLLLLWLLDVCIFQELDMCFISFFLDHFLSAFCFHFTDKYHRRDFFFI